MPLFPVIMDPAAFRAWRGAASQWRAAVVEIARLHKLRCNGMHAFSTGTNLVVALNDETVLKVFPPFYRNQFDSERHSLAQLAGRVEVAIPKLILQGQRDGWSYLAITRVDGVIGDSAWPLTSENEKESILRQIGETIAQVQRAPLGPLADIEPQWLQFVDTQIAGCRARHEWLGMPLKLLNGLEEILAEARQVLPFKFTPVILTGEYIPENFLLADGANGWRLAGLFDFGDVMTGWGEYDLLGPSAFMTAGKPGRVRALLHGFGYHGRRGTRLWRGDS
jgi:hygromycin-B 7''-O-kinase